MYLSANKQALGVFWFEYNEFELHWHVPWMGNCLGCIWMHRNNYDVDMRVVFTVASYCVRGYASHYNCAIIKNFKGFYCSLTFLFYFILIIRIFFFTIQSYILG